MNTAYTVAIVTVVILIGLFVRFRIRRRNASRPAENADTLPPSSRRQRFWNSRLLRKIKGIWERIKPLPIPPPPASPTTPEEEKITRENRVRRWKEIDAASHRLFWWVIIGTYGIFLAADAVLFLKGLEWWGIGCLAAEIFLAADSIVPINENEIGMKIWFGRAIYETRSGPSFTPWFLGVTIMKAPRTWQRISLPGGREKVVGENKVQLMQITFSGGGAPKKETHPLDTTTTGELRVDARFRISEGRFREFIRGNQTMADAAENLGIFVDTQVTAKTSKLSGKAFLDSIESLNGVLEQLADQAVYSLGMDTTIHIQGVEWPPDVQKALDGIAKTQADAVAIRTTAEAEKDATIEKAEGNRQKGLKEAEVNQKMVQAPIDGMTNGLKRQVEELKVSGEDLMKLQTAKEMAGAMRSNTLVFRGKEDGGGILDIGLGIALGSSVAQQLSFDSRKTGEGKAEKGTPGKGAGDDADAGGAQTAPSKSDKNQKKGSEK